MVRLLLRISRKKRINLPQEIAGYSSDERPLEKSNVKTEPRLLQGLKRALLFFVGTLCVILGVIGILFPVLPTTPFLLLAAICYARSSERFYHWLMNNRWCGKYIRNYREGRGIPVKQKIFTLVLLWLTIAFTTVLVVSQWWVRVILLGIAVGVTIHLMKIKTYAQKKTQHSPVQRSENMTRQSKHNHF